MKNNWDMDRSFFFKNKISDIHNLRVFFFLETQRKANRLSGKQTNKKTGRFFLALSKKKGREGYKDGWEISDQKKKKEKGSIVLRIVFGFL